jgi:hypothetical protein
MSNSPLPFSVNPAVPHICVLMLKSVCNADATDNSLTILSEYAIQMLKTYSGTLEHTCMILGHV